MSLTSYQIRLLVDIGIGLESARRLLERSESEDPDELMSRLPAIRTQAQQAAMAASELYGAMSSELEKGRERATLSLCHALAIDEPPARAHCHLTGYGRTPLEAYEAAMSLLSRVHQEWTDRWPPANAA